MINETIQPYLDTLYSLRITIAIIGMVLFIGYILLREFLRNIVETIGYGLFVLFEQVLKVLRF